MIINYKGTDYDCSDEFSFKDFTGCILDDRDLNGLIVYGSCLSHERPDSQIFKQDLTGATFVKCNLDNVFIPPGNTVIDCSIRRFMNNPDDNQDWLVDDNNQFVSPLNGGQ